MAPFTIFDYNFEEVKVGFCPELRIQTLVRVLRACLAILTF